MAVIAAILQLAGGQSSSSSYKGVNAFFTISDSTIPLDTPEASADNVQLPLATPGTWKDLIVAAVVARAAELGYTITADKVFYLCYEPGDYKDVNFAGCWTKDATKTNIGVALVNVYTGANGEAQVVDFSRYKQYRLIVTGNKVGTGNLTHGLYELGATTNKLETIYTGAAGEFMDDSGWTALPAWAAGEKNLKPMALSSVSTDDPVYRGFQLYLR